MEKVLIIHSRRTGYGVLRSAFDKNIYTIIADDVKTPLFYSNKVCASYIIPNINNVSDEVFIENILDIGSKEYKGKKIIIFTGRDDYLLLLSKYSEVLSKYFILSFEKDIAKLENVLGKVSLSKIANKAGVLSPLSLSKSSTEQEFNNLYYPCIIKPDFKSLPEIDVVEKVFRLNICNNSNELNESISKLNKYDLDYIVQEYIPGDDSTLYTVGAYVYEGKLLAYSMSQKLRQFPVNTGECSYGQLINDDSLIDTCIKLVNEANFTGICQIEFKKYKDDYYLIEINPRVWSWHEIHKLAGVDLVSICIDSLYYNKNDHLIKPKKVENMYWHFALMDLLHNNILNKNISLYEWVKSILSSKIHAFYCKNDIKPVVVHTFKTLKYIFNYTKK